MTSFGNGRVSTSNALAHPSLACRQVLPHTDVWEGSLLWCTVKQPRWPPRVHLPRLPNLHFTLGWGRGSPRQCSGGSIHNSVSFLLLCLASCYAKIVRGGQWSVATERDTHPQKATALEIPQKHESSKPAPQRHFGSKDLPECKDLASLRRNRKPVFSLPPFLLVSTPHLLSLSLFLSFSLSCCYWDHSFTNSCKRHSHVFPKAEFAL